MQLKSKISFDDTSIAFSAKSDKALKKAYILFSVISFKFLSDFFQGAVKLALAIGFPIKWAIKRTVFEQFCGGEDIQESKATIDELNRFNIGAILDYSVEGAKTEEGFDETMKEILLTVDYAKENDSTPFSVFKITGIASSALLQKIQNSQPLTSIELHAFDRVKERLDKICGKAFEHNVRVMIDAEESWIQNPIDELAYAMMEKYNQHQPIVYNTYQMYRHDMLDNLRKAFHYAAMNNYYIGAKLVRGAYMEKERERAAEMGYDSPIQKDKAATDGDFDKGIAFCIDQKQRVSLVCGSHNEYSNYYLALLMEKHGMLPGDKRVWFAQLYGMSDNISFNLAEKGYNVAKYVPYGPVKAVMPYLFRRADENTSVAGQSGRELTMIKNEMKRRSNSK